MDPYQHYGPPPNVTPPRGPSGPAITVTMLLLLGCVGAMLVAMRLYMPSNMVARQERDRAPADAAAPTPTPIPGWVMFEGAGVDGTPAEIWLPERFRGGDMQRDWPALRRELEAEGGERNELLKPKLDQLQQTAQLATMAMMDFSEEYIGTTVTIAHMVDQGPAYDTLDESAAALLEGIAEGVAGSAQVELLEQRDVVIAGLPARRLLISMGLATQELPLRMLTYMLEYDNNFWIISYGTDADLYPRLAPMFEQSVRTFRWHER